MRVNGFTVDQREGKTVSALVPSPGGGSLGVRKAEVIWDISHRDLSMFHVIIPIPSHTEPSLKENGRLASDSMNPRTDSSGCWCGDSDLN